MPTYPPPDDIASVVPGLRNDALGLDLLKCMLCYDPGRRISAADALKHEYFADVPSGEEGGAAGGSGGGGGGGGGGGAGDGAGAGRAAEGGGMV